MLHVATDWAPYAASILCRTRAEPLLTDDHGYADRPAHRPVTRFEQQGIDKGHQVVDISCRRRA